MAVASAHSRCTSPFPPVATRPRGFLRFFPTSVASTPTFPCRAQAATARTTLKELCGGRVPDSILTRNEAIYESKDPLLIILYGIRALVLCRGGGSLSSYLVAFCAVAACLGLIVRLEFVNLHRIEQTLAEEVGYVLPTDVQEQSLPVLLSRQDCVLHAQTGSGKTLAYLLAIFSAIDISRSTVQAVIVVPTRELGMQVTKVARILAAKPKRATENASKECGIMALLDGGMLTRQKSWLKAEPPQIIVATVESLCRIIDRHLLNFQSITILVIDEFDYLFGSTKQVSLLRKLLTSYSSSTARQTVFASASIPQHNRFLHDCVQHKWTKRDVVHVHVNRLEPMPSHLQHNFVICTKEERLQVLLQLLDRDKPKSGIIFVSEQSEKSRSAGHIPSITLVNEFLKDSYDGELDVLVLEQDMNFNARATSFLEVKHKGFLLVSTDIASRGFDLPQTTHIYNFDLPKTAVDYLHRAGRTGRNPFSKELCTVTTFITEKERFVLRRFENELKFRCELIPL